MSTTDKIDEGNLIITGIYSKLIDNLVEQLADYVYIGFDGAVSTVMYTLRRMIAERREVLEDPHTDEAARERITKELQIITGLFGNI